MTVSSRRLQPRDGCKPSSKAIRRMYANAQNADLRGGTPFVHRWMAQEGVGSKGSQPSEASRSTESGFAFPERHAEVKADPGDGRGRAADCPRHTASYHRDQPVGALSGRCPGVRETNKFFLPLSISSSFPEVYSRATALLQHSSMVVAAETSMFLYRRSMH